MIYIVSGSVNTGKTSRLQEIFKTVPATTAGGFLSAKLFSPDFVGYEITCLSTGIKMPLAFLSSVYRGQFSQPINFKQFVFSQQAFDFGASIINRLVAAETIMDIIIDEIGPLELSQRGFYQAFNKALTSDKNIYVAIRCSCLNDVIAGFNLKEYSIIKQ